MIRFDQRNLDVQATERVFKKVVHPSHNAIRLVDQDGIPLRSPTTQALSRLHSTYVLSPRGVPTKKSNHAYSGQLTQAKLQTLIKDMDPANSQEMQSYTSMHNYGSGLSSAGSSRHYMPSNLTPKKRGFGSGPPRSVKSMPAKSAASSRRTPRYLTSAAATDIAPEEPDDMVLDNADKSNDSAQGQRLEKEWSNLSQCRALKRSSEIVSHRVDRMYFMTGNKLKLQSKYHIEDDELKQLRELSQARASSRASRSGKSRKGEVYRPLRSSLSQKALSCGEDSISINGTSLVQKENADPSIVVSQKPINSKRAGLKSPLQGWRDEEKPDKSLQGANDIVCNTGLHQAQDNADKGEDQDNVKDEVEKSEAQIVNEADTMDKTQENDKAESEIEVTIRKTNEMNGDDEGEVTEGNRDEGDDGRLVNHNEDEEEEGTGVHYSNDNDKTVVKSEDYLKGETTEAPTEKAED